MAEINFSFHYSYVFHDLAAKHRTLVEEASDTFPKNSYPSFQHLETFFCTSQQRFVDGRLPYTDDYQFSKLSEAVNEAREARAVHSVDEIRWNSLLASDYYRDLFSFFDAAVQK